MKTVKSCLTEKDVSAICEMQRKIDAYESFIIMLHGMVSEEDPEVKCLLFDTPLDCYMNALWKEVREMVQNKVLNEL